MDGASYVQVLALQLMTALATLGGALVIFHLTAGAQREAAKEEVREQWKLFRKASQIQFLQWSGERKLEALHADLVRASAHVDIANTIRVEIDRLEKELQYGKAFAPAATIDVTMLDSIQREYVSLPFDLASDIGHVHTSTKNVNLLGAGFWTPAHDALLGHVQAAKTLFDTRIGDLELEKRQASSRINLDTIAIEHSIEEARAE